MLKKIVKFLDEVIKILLRYMAARHLAFPHSRVKNVNDLTNFVAKWIEFYFHDIKNLKKLGQKLLREKR